MHSNIAETMLKHSKIILKTNLSFTNTHILEHDKLRVRVLADKTKIYRMEFDTLDEDKSGAINASKLGDLLKAVGWEHRWVAS